MIEGAFMTLTDAAAWLDTSGSLKASSLRTEAERVRLQLIKIAGKHFVTENALKEMVERCQLEQKPPRLWLRKREGRAAVWLIKDGGQQYVTGCSEEDRAGAENALAEFIASKWKAPDATQSDMSVSNALAIYGREHGATTADPARIGYAIDALMEFWPDKKVSNIRGEECRKYDRFRDRAPATVRRELGTVRAALRYCVIEGYLRAAPAIWLPEKPPSKDRWLTRDEAARLLWAARSEGKRSAHLVRFILIGLYTGTRKDAILKLGGCVNLAGGHVDLENGLICRQSASAMRTKKRQSLVRIPRRLVNHLSRWEGDGQWVIEYSERRVLDIKRGWSSARDRAGLEGVTPYVPRHTAITWAMQRGARIEDASVFFAISMEELQRTYWHHHPDAQGSVIDALDRR